MHMLFSKHFLLYTEQVSLTQHTNSLDVWKTKFSPFTFLIFAHISFLYSPDYANKLLCTCIWLVPSFLKLWETELHLIFHFFHEYLL